MTGHRSFRTLRDAMSPERQAQNAAPTKAALTELALHELRRIRDLSQADLATALGVGQSAVAKMERRTDMYVSSLRSYIEAMGGTLEITARFDDAEVIIRNFGDLASATSRDD
jgi:hypothetical protein